LAALDYATLGGVKRRMEITDTDDDDVLLDIIADVNLDVEDMTGRPIGPTTATAQLIDGYDAVEDGRCLVYPRGIRSVTTLEVASGTGADFNTVPAADIYVRPSEYARQPDWPAFEIWMTDSPSASNAMPYFAPGIDNIRLTGLTGWAAIPETITSAAEVTVARTFLSNRGGFTEGDEELGERSYRALWRGMDIRTIKRYTLKSVEII